MKKKTILVLGCMGHLGFSISKYLSKKNLKVYGIYNKTLDKYKKKDLENLGVKLIKNDLSNKNKILNLIKKFKITDCIYTSAIAHDSIAKIRPEDTIKVNSLYPNLFIQMQKKKIINKFIYISTGSVFQNIKSNKIKIFENSAPSPKSLYAISKRAAEILIENNFYQSRKKICILRVSWVYGPPLITRKIVPQRGPIPYVLNEILIKKKKNIFLPGKDFEASFTYIDDVCENIFKLLNLSYFKQSIYHLGKNKNNKINELILILKRNFKNINIKTTKGFNPWSSDSVVRGPLASNSKNKLVNCRFDLSRGIKEFTKYIKSYA